MSYDLFVFDPGKAPANKADFLKWFEKMTEWEGDYAYDDISICPPALQNWYREMLTTFPAMNGPDAVTDEEFEDDDDGRVTDYSIAREGIYVGFRWSQADKAYETMRALAQKHAVGFFDVSGTEDIIVPGKTTFSMDLHGHIFEHEKLSAELIVDAINSLDRDTYIILEPDSPIESSIYLQAAPIVIGPGSGYGNDDDPMLVEIRFEYPDRSFRHFRYETDNRNEICNFFVSYWAHQQLPELTKFKDVTEEFIEKHKV